MPEQFQHRPTKVEAIQATIHSVEAIMKWSESWSAAYTVTLIEQASAPSEILLMIYTREQIRYAIAGDWVVMDEDGNVTTMSSRDFARAYEPIPTRNENTEDAA